MGRVDGLGLETPIAGIRQLHLSRVEQPLDENPGFKGAQGPIKPLSRQGDPISASGWLASGVEGAGRFLREGHEGQGRREGTFGKLRGPIP